jgi:hypothetical protein
MDVFTLREHALLMGDECIGADPYHVRSSMEEENYAAYAKRQIL